MPTTKSDVLTYNDWKELQSLIFVTQIYNEQEPGQQILIRQLLSIKDLVNHPHRPEILLRPTMEMFQRPTLLQCSDLTLD